MELKQWKLFNYTMSINVNGNKNFLKNKLHFYFNVKNTSVSRWAWLKVIQLE